MAHTIRFVVEAEATMSDMILHITKRSEWEQAQQAGVYRGDTLHTEGFIHCSTPQQVLGPANAFYRGQPDLVLLCIDPDKLESPLRYEALGTDQAFPHIYGPLNMDAVVDVVPFPPREDGMFMLPEAVRGVA
jgi:uncharacterized protein (DUF952 family)